MKRIIVILTIVLISVMFVVFNCTVPKTSSKDSDSTASIGGGTTSSLTSSQAAASSDASTLTPTSLTYTPGDNSTNIKNTRI